MLKVYGLKYIRVYKITMEYFIQQTWLVPHWECCHERGIYIDKHRTTITQTTLFINRSDLAVTPVSGQELVYLYNTGGEIFQHPPNIDPTEIYTASYSIHFYFQACLFHVYFTHVYCEFSYQMCASLCLFVCLGFLHLAC